MAGLFGGGKVGAAGKDHGFDWGDAAMGFFGVNPAALNARRQKERESAAAAEQQRRIATAIDSDPTLSPLDREYAKANPEAYIKVRMERFRPLDSGPGGGSRGLPGPDGQITNWQMAPSRMEYQGSVSDIGPSVPGQKATVTPQHEGTQWITPQPGTTAFGVNSFTGLPRTGGGTAAPPAPSSGPMPGQIEDGYRFKGGDPADPASWEPVAQGGAPQQGARMFPGPH